MVKNTTKKKSKSSKSLSGNKMWVVAAIVFALAGAGLIFGVLSNITATTSYYVLNTDVPSRSQITPSMLQEVQASKGTQPRNALSLEEVTYNDVYAKVELHTGDVLSASNTGDLTPLHQGVPEDFVIASFVVEPNLAVAGKVTTGNYIDIYATAEGGEDAKGKTTKAVLRHVLVMDAQGSASEFEESEDVTDETSAQDTLREGLPFLYTVALNEEDAAVLANVSQDDLFVTLSSEKSNTEFESKDISTTNMDIFADRKVGDSGKDTDPTFGKGENNDENAEASAE